MRPNLFRDAPSELSQDAILCWLLRWADQKQQSQDLILHQVGREFLDSIYEKAKVTKPPTYESIKIFKQDGRIDVLCIVNGDMAIIIEDKTGTKQHSDQLARYKQHVSDRKFSADKIIPVYLQTRDQSDYSEVEKNGYLKYERRDLLKVLEGPHGKAGCEKSDILSDFAAYLRRIEDRVQSFRTLPPESWCWESWKGFYTELQEALNGGNWDYVPNQSGGFLGFWWHFVENEQGGPYLQLEQDKFCFKIWVKDPEKRRALREFWHNRIMKECSLRGLKAKRPGRFGNGDVMTVAILDQEFRVVNHDQQLDLEKTLTIFRTAEAVLEALKTHQML